MYPKAGFSRRDLVRPFSNVKIALAPGCHSGYCPAALSPIAKGQDMVTTRGLVRAAGTALLVLSGCTVGDYFSLSYWQRDSSGQTTGLNVTRSGGHTTATLIGNQDVIALRFRNALAQLGMQAQITNDVDGIRITSVTQSGKQLTVALKPGTGDSTNVEMAWSGEADGQVQANLMRLVIGANGR